MFYEKKQIVSVLRLSKRLNLYLYNTFFYNLRTLTFRILQINTELTKRTIKILSRKNMNIKSERLKKLETELHDLDQWLKLGLVPKKDLEKHKEEMRILNEKIHEEKERLRFLKESGDSEEYVAPKRLPHGRPAFQETASLPDIDMGDEGLTDAGLDMETDSYELETSAGEEGDEEGLEEDGLEEEEEEDPFSDRNRWRRGILEDPDADDW